MQAALAGIAHSAVLMLMFADDGDETGSPRYVAAHNAGTPVAALAQVVNAPVHASCATYSLFI